MVRKFVISAGLCAFVGALGGCFSLNWDENTRMIDKWGRDADDIRALLTIVQHQLFDLGGELCIPGHAAITGDDVEALERQLDHYNDDLPPLKDFILPAGGEAASRCHLARTIVRRAERETVTLARHDAVRPEAIRYLNRLSDLLFVLARVLARADGQGEVLWKHERRHA